jgi:hypothetical protein
MMDAHDKHEEILAKRREEREKKRQESLKSQFEQ